MSGVNIPIPEILTVGALLDYLRKMEESWTDEDMIYLGKFRNHKINIPYFRNGIFKGYGIGQIHYDGGLDFIIDMPMEEIKKDGR